MPSANYIVKLSKNKRVWVNVCEGQVFVQYEVLTSGWWEVNERVGPLPEDQARKLAQTILQALDKN